MKLRFVLLSVLLMTAMLVGQTFRGTILGTVTDPPGVAVAGATVKVKNAATGLERTTTTSADGSYALSELPIGTYSVTVSQTGFQTALPLVWKWMLPPSGAWMPQLKTGQVTQTVEVSGGRPSPDRDHHATTSAVC